ncbi:MAG: hypothetical protein IT323_00085 [Anaerolineae bacterium]|nr:hypothetical protein [Anaerolineae bacterium]
MQRWKLVLILTLLVVLASLPAATQAQDGPTITSVSVPDTVPGGGTRLRLSPDGRYLAAWTDGNIVGDMPSPLFLPIHLFDLSDPAAPRDVFLIGGQTDHAAGAAFSPDNTTLVTYQRNSQFFVWDTATGDPVKQFFPGALGGAAFDFLPDGQTIAWVWPTPYQQTALLNMETEGYTRILARRLATWAEYTTQGERTIPATLMALAVAPDGAHVATATMYGDILLWDVATGEMRALLMSEDTMPQLAVRTLAFSPDGATLYFNNNREEKLYALDVASTAVREIDAAPLGLFALMGDTGNIALAGPDSASVVIIDPANPKSRQEIPLPLDSNTGPKIPGQRALGTFAASANRIVFGGFGNEETEQTVIFIITLP